MLDRTMMAGMEDFSNMTSHPPPPSLFQLIPIRLHFYRKAISASHPPRLFMAFFQMKRITILFKKAKTVFP
jgi:hypothetical protein